MAHPGYNARALEVAARVPAPVNRLTLIGTAFPMKVADALLEGSVKSPANTMEMVNIFSRATVATVP